MLKQWYGEFSFDGPVESSQLTLGDFSKPGVIQQAFQEAKLSPQDIDAFAYATRSFHPSHIVHGLSIETASPKVRACSTVSQSPVVPLQPWLLSLESR